MKTKAKRYILALSALFMFAAPLSMTALAGAQSSEGQTQINAGLCTGASLSATETCSPQDTGAAAAESVNTIITTVINIFSLAVGVVSVIMIIIGGFRYITSGGESGSVTGAKNTILYAIIGLVIVALAQVIVRFVLGKVAPTT